MILEVIEFQTVARVLVSAFGVFLTTKDLV